MRKRLIRKTFDMIQEISESENKEVCILFSNFVLLRSFDVPRYSCGGMNDSRTTRNFGRTLVDSLNWVALKTLVTTSVLHRCLDSSVPRMKKN